MNQIWPRKSKNVFIRFLYFFKIKKNVGHRNREILIIRNIQHNKVPYREKDTFYLWWHWLKNMLFLECQILELDQLVPYPLLAIYKGLVAVLESKKRGRTRIISWKEKLYGRSYVMRLQYAIKWWSQKELERKHVVESLRLWKYR